MGQRMKNLGSGNGSAVIDFSHLVLGQDLARQIAGRQHPEPDFEEHEFGKGLCFGQSNALNG